MSDPLLDSLAVGLSEAEKHDLEEMIGEFRGCCQVDCPSDAREPIQAQLDSLALRMADLTEMVLAIDRRLAPLAEVLRLSHQKSELLNQRLDAVIDALKKGTPL